MRPGRFLIVLLISLLASACGVTVKPVATSSATVDLEDNSITEAHDGVVITAKVDQLSVAPYQMVDNITSFHLVIDNRTATPVTIPLASFVLRDSEGRQYRTISPEEVREIVSRDTVYLIPYPYVGYYYLEDRWQGAYRDSFASSLPFYAEYHPQDLFTRALPQGPVLPGAKIAGVIYFIADLERASRAELLVLDNSGTGSAPRYLFPFVVER